MRVEWSRAKAAASILKHRVQFAEAAEALNDIYAVTVEDRGHHEQRFHTVAMSQTGDVLVVAYALPNDETIRIISARKASRAERRSYFAGRQHEC